MKPAHLILRVAIHLLPACPVLVQATVSDPVELFKRHHYENAAVVWQKDIHASPLNEKGVRSLKGVSLAYYQLGSLYARLQPFSLALSNEYYHEVLSQVNSPWVYDYLGQIQYQRGHFDSASIAFEKTRKAQTKGGSKTGEWNGAFLEYSKTHGQNFNASALKSSEAKWQALDLAKVQPSAIPIGLKANSQRARRCRLSILSRSDLPMIVETEAALKAVLRDANRPEMVQDSGRNTQLDFYDPFLLETLSRAYFSLSRWEQMRLLEEEKHFPDLAAKFKTRNTLSETCLMQGRYEEALKFLGTSNDFESQILRAKILGKQGKPAEARPLLQAATQEANSPVLLREIAESYYFLSIDLDKGLSLASQALKDKDGANYYRISAALLLATGQNDAALREYAKGYKEEFRNQIEQVDPEYMSDYSFAIFLSDKMRYGEVVETLYHLQKDFPACRQMHYAMQGISSGLVRNYEVQRIFRKGG